QRTARTCSDGSPTRKPPRRYAASDRNGCAEAEAMAEIAGVDFAYTHPNPAAVRAADYRFVMGYVSNSPGKNMTAALAQSYLAAGLGVGLVWETAADRVKSGGAGGGADGAAASAQAKAIGYPTNCHLYFAVDYAEPASDFPVTAAYASAFNSACAYPV